VPHGDGDLVRRAPGLLRIGSSTLPPYGATGKYYGVTRAGVRELQQLVHDRHDSSVTVDGVVGAETWAWLDELAPR
jgi:hypothetical protein